MRWTLVVVPPPSFNGLLSFVNLPEPVQVQVLLTHRPIEALNERVVRRFSWSAGVKPHIVAVSPQIHQEPGKFAAIVHKYSNRRAAAICSATAAAPRCKAGMLFPYQDAIPHVAEGYAAAGIRNERGSQPARASSISTPPADPSASGNTAR